MIKRIGLILFITTLGLVVTQGCYYDNEEELYPGTTCDTVDVSYSSTIEPLIQGNCATSGCHSGANPAAGLKLETYEEIRAASLNGSISDRINRPAGDPLLMPPTGKLGNCQILKVDAWTDQGANNN